MAPPTEEHEAARGTPRNGVAAEAPDSQPMGETTKRCTPERARTTAPNMPLGRAEPPPSPPTLGAFLPTLVARPHTLQTWRTTHCTP